MKGAVDTNVPIVANGRDGIYSPECRKACIKALTEMVRNGVAVLDSGRHMLKEYRTHLNQDGQPGVGDQFYQHVPRNFANPRRVRQVDAPCDPDGHVIDFPKDPALASFDPSDRVCATVAMKSGAPVLNAVDSDWWDHDVALKRNGIDVVFLCGRVPGKGR
ncbi:hypothetical protein HL658_30425 [Azospirillum sp. RWY-5-1]|uniref:Uncharacterized protein n=1 Tax=Azospirillum oleiclasticum TaxID=2735135 RepID=A0ABX2TCC3_9PROT|nr:hypothetical protein [Azospirillum oleiclasticum]NYZ16882.1 hypothetical protein [Azospirillum oleiclasticum]NYZ21819.1 hypothetical protein [Azospirillum oleiclasticum]